jgi:hypothetical protein
MIFIPLTVVLKESFLGWSNYEGRLKSSWTRLSIPFTFSRSGWSIVSALLAKGGTSKRDRHCTSRKF